MELLFIRHALPVRVEDADGPADPVLSEAGIRQAAALAAWLRDEPLDAIWVSPLRRARQTAAPIEAALGLTAVVEAGIQEFDAEDPTYIPIEELRAADDPRWREMVEALDSPERLAFRDVVVEAVERIVAAHPGQKVAVVCHGGVINAYLSHVVGIDVPMFFEPSYTSLTRIVASSRGHRSMVSANEIPHLPELRR
ncbi:MAG TPA: histidine phosphatase family protein [Acidimicrobiales bacterium]|nr:histidine phosphatase family protein [Acidimicrobiales bacterium]